MEAKDYAELLAKTIEAAQKDDISQVASNKLANMAKETTSKLLSSLGAKIDVDSMPIEVAALYLSALLLAERGKKQK